MTRIAWLSPLHGDVFCKSSAFTKAILGVLPVDWDVELFVDDASLRSGLRTDTEGETAEPGWRNVAVHHFHRLCHRHAAKQFDLFVYQLEDCPACSFVQHALPLWPGICFVHDLNLNRLFLNRFRHCTAGTEIDDEARELFGDKVSPLGKWFERGWPLDVFDSFYARGLDVASRAGVAVLPCGAWKLRVAEARPNLSVEFVPMPVQSRPKQVSVGVSGRLRQELGLKSEDVVIGYSGRHLLQDRAEHVLSAYSALLDRLPFGDSGSIKAEQVHFVWLVSSEASFEQAQQKLERFDIGRELCKVAHVVLAEDEASFYRMFSVFDVFLGLSNDQLRGVPRPVFEAMARGIPAVLSDIVCAEEFPDSVCLKLPVGQGEKLAITTALEALVFDDRARRRFGVNGREYVEQVCNPVGVVEDITVLIDRYGRSLTAAVHDNWDACRLQSLRLEAELFADLSQRVLGGGKLGHDEDAGIDLYELTAKRAFDDFGWRALYPGAVIRR